MKLAATISLPYSPKGLRMTISLYLRTAGVSYLFGGPDRIDLPMVLDKLAPPSDQNPHARRRRQDQRCDVAGGLIDELSLP
jgi:hypothetical protein